VAHGIFCSRKAIMPTIFDNIDQKLLPALQQTLALSYRADFSVGYFNLRGWRYLDARIDEWTGGAGAQCRLIVGMQNHPKDEVRAVFSFRDDVEAIDNKTALQLKKKLAAKFRRRRSRR
jgi:hypothetical protein